jgi:hypothetical protein
MKSVWSASIALMGSITVAGAEPQVEPAASQPPIQLAGNTSSNSSSNTSSNSSARGSSYVHTDDWSIESDDNGRRRNLRGSTRIERYAPDRRRRPAAVYEHFRDDD